MRDGDWLVPGMLLTLVSAAAALSLIPDRSGIMPALSILPLWMMAAAMVAAVCGIWKMIRAGVQRPIAHVGARLRDDPERAALLVGATLLAGLNMIVFMWTKPLLNQLVPFRADPMLAAIDNLLFLGRDPWTLLQTLNTTPLAIFYHRGWFALMILALIVTLAAPRSPERSATLLTYFLLWSVAGPVVHLLLPAAGPIFYSQLGYGDRFAGLDQVSATRDVAEYLWRFYATTGFGPGSGISAMPSMHVATTAWMLSAFRRFAPSLKVPAAAAALLIVLLSIALGWHYAVDGIIGASVALLCDRILLRIYSAPVRRVRADKPPVRLGAA